MPDGNTHIAVFRVEGALVRRSALGCAAWLAMAQREVLGRAARVGLVGLAGTLAAPLGPAVPLRLAWRALAGCSEDRFAVLADFYGEDLVASAWNEPGLRLVERCREAGDTIVLLSDHPEACLGPLVTRVRPDLVLANHLVIEHGRLTGALAEPVHTARADGGWLRALAQQRGHDPQRVRAYGARADDATLLSGAPLPCAVTPDRALRQLARTFSWPVVDA